MSGIGKASFVFVTQGAYFKRFTVFKGIKGDKT